MSEPRTRWLEWVGWGALATISLTTAALAVLRPVDSQHISSRIRLAAGFDRYETALGEAHRLFSRATADGRMRGPSEHDRQTGYAMLAGAEKRLLEASAEAGEIGEPRRVERALWRVYMAWARALLADGASAPVEGDGGEALKRARAIVGRALALPGLRPEERVEAERLQFEIDARLKRESAR